MAAGDLITADWQLEFGGLLIGDGTPYDIVEMSGLDQPEVRFREQPRLQNHGVYSSDEFVDSRRIVLSITTSAGSHSELATLLDALAKAFMPGADEAPLVFQLPGYAKRQVNVRVRRRSMTVNRDYMFRLPGIVVELAASDPRIYSTTQSTQSWGLTNVTAGLTFSAGFDMSFGGSVTASSRSLNNAGTFATRPVCMIAGPISNPTITHEPSGKYLAFTGSLVAFEWLDIDLEARTVLLNGAASRYSWLTADSQWWELAPGANPIRFTAGAYDTGLLTVTWRSAWL